MQFQVMVMLLRSIIGLLDPDQIELVRNRLMQFDPGPDPASDKFANDQRRMTLKLIDEAIREVETHGGRT